MAKDAKNTEAPAKTETKATTAEADRPKRKSLTPAERVAKLEAELAAAREKANSRARKQVERLTAQLDALVAKRDELNKKIESVEAERKDAEAQAKADEAGTTDESDAA